MEITNEREARTYGFPPRPSGYKQASARGPANRLSSSGHGLWTADASHSISVKICREQRHVPLLLVIVAAVALCTLLAMLVSERHVHIPALVVTSRRGMCYVEWSSNRGGGCQEDHSPRVWGDTWGPMGGGGLCDGTRRKISFLDY